MSFWRYNEIATLRRMAAEGQPIKAIAAELGRGYESVRTYAITHGITTRRQYAMDADDPRLASGVVMVRMTKELHHRLAKRAIASGQTMNEIMVRALEREMRVVSDEVQS